MNSDEDFSKKLDFYINEIKEKIKDTEVEKNIKKEIVALENYNKFNAMKIESYNNQIKSLKNQVSYLEKMVTILADMRKENDCKDISYIK